MADAPGPGGTGISHRPPTSGAPRWVKVLVIITAVIVLLLVLGQITGIGGGHGPGRHLQSGGVAELAAPAGPVDHGTGP